ncbi:dTDP-4-dehydrorhamnose 3,5-epimerase family protein [Streptomyces tendae]|uniref:dTDP-4-dehydrorhamnose 3,5-epimerase family protein n=1 Tax=Streptomyces tendae TaxID=1932 RepID=A0A6B3QSM6_STRTE|nr:MULTISPECIES: dTDP-4-dehydrorhamnose 3,5-epimerase family protein [Streptomyces]BET45134.1 dTDP-4-dehydrorhamnose 3,5-epimerase [Kitasatospora aureofaciens]MBQ0969419.1 dTDP-4-dehydrorhamnose 3,5-epimerase family protein [Streptomyces sp. RK74B]MBQ1009047.1 dTDP-4-dehydrorhamnose 3,5-epimerase family protein [Streptomyces sp. RK23]MZG15403.1 dTDP-4-keto-6-deoxy-D-glucose epimerase [Streptomyces sp. SID5914]NEV89947.1 dTDP-4-keto-6-deoxy-D-glucose epimerase [Streptomyces tendae]
MRTRALAVAGAFEFTPQTHTDERGLFVSPLQESAFVAAVGHDFSLAQTNHSSSTKGALRGIHFTTTPPGQAKYVYCARGRAMDVVVDVRVGSPTFGRWDVVHMDARTFRATYFPVGVGHAFLALDDDTVMSYLVSTAYRAELEQAIDPFDPTLGVPWPSGMEFVVSGRDRDALSLAQAEAAGGLPLYSDCLALEEGRAAAGVAEAGRRTGGPE